MVLQRAPASAKLWGWATAGEQVSILFNNQVFLLSLFLILFHPFLFFYFYLFIIYFYLLVILLIIIN